MEFTTSVVRVESRNTEVLNSKAVKIFWSDMYNWRKMSVEQREDVLKLRKSQKLPWHSPPHHGGSTRRFHVSGACYEHQPIIGKTVERISAFKEDLMNKHSVHGSDVLFGVVLPNHYHILVYTEGIEAFLKSIFKLHQSTAYKWNREDMAKGRKVWCNVVESAIKSERHFWATMNYIHHNPVKHGYVKTWTEWPYSTAKDYLERVGREQALETWKEYDISEMGKEWDEVDVGVHDFSREGGKSQH